MPSREAMYDEIQTLRAKLKEAEENRNALWIGEHDQRNRAIRAERLLDQRTRALDRLVKAVWIPTSGSDGANTELREAVEEARAALEDSATEEEK